MTAMILFPSTSCLPDNPHGAGESACSRNEFGCSPGMEAEFIDDGELLFNHAKGSVRDFLMSDLHVIIGMPQTVFFYFSQT